MQMSTLWQIVSSQINLDDNKEEENQINYLKMINIRTDYFISTFCD